jgi:hypothetical protein
LKVSGVCLPPFNLTWWNQCLLGESKKLVTVNEKEAINRDCLTRKWAMDIRCPRVATQKVGAEVVTGEIPLEQLVR